MRLLERQRLAILVGLVALCLAAAHAASGVSTPTRWIVFSAVPKGQVAAQLFRVETTGAGLEQITTDRKTASEPSFSPNGKRLVFARLGSGVFVVNLDGSGLRRLTTAPRDQFPVWSPDGRHIAFLRIFRSVWRLYLTSPSGQGVHRLSLAPPGGRPWWTADSKSIFVPVQAALVKIDARTGRQQRRFIIPIDLGTSNAATMSPNSRRVAYIAPRPSLPTCEDTSCAVYALYLADVPGGRPRRVANDTGPVGWSPDSARMVFVHRGGLALWPVGAGGTRTRTP
jgi:Tol biopolymer transport system component